MVADLYHLTHHSVYSSFILRETIINDIDSILCLNDIIEYIIDDNEEK